MGINNIALPTGAAPFELVSDSASRRLYVSDQNRASIYVIDIDPFSPTYHELIQTINIPSRLDRELGIGLIGLRGIAIDGTDNRLFVTAPRQDLFRSSGFPGDGHVVSIVLRDEDGAYLEAPIVDPDDPLAVTRVSPGVSDITITDDPDVLLVTDRVDDRHGFSVLRKDVSGSFDVDEIDFTEYGAIPLRTEGRGTQVHGVSNAQSVVFVSANQFEDQIGPHDSYAIVAGYRRFRPGDPKTDPTLGPFLVYNSEVRTDDNSRVETFLASAGGTLGIIRNPLGDFDTPLDRPRLVAATDPIPNSFTDSVALASQSGVLLAAQQGVDLVTGYDLASMIFFIEDLAGADRISPWNQSPPFPNELLDQSALLAGPLSTIPIDRVFPTTAVAGDYRFFESDGNIFFGTNPIGPDGNSPNLYAPLPGNNLPRGLSAQSEAPAALLTLQATPYNPISHLPAFGSQPMIIEAGRSATAEIHVGALQERHALVSYRSQEQDRSLQFVYDSFRADPRPIFHINTANLHELDFDVATDRFGYKLTAIGPDGERFEADGATAEDAERLGVAENTNFFKLPDADSQKTYGAALQVDLYDAPTGLYTMQAEFGLLRAQGDRFVGSLLSQTFIHAHVNATESSFGAGWGIAGYMRAYPGDAGVLLVDGDGHEQIFLAPEEGTGLFTPIVNDFSELRIEGDGFQRRLRNGTIERYDSEGLLESITDRNGNQTVYEHDGDRLVRIVDPVGLETVFNYSGDTLNSIVDPANRSTQFQIDGDGKPHLDHGPGPDSANLCVQLSTRRRCEPRRPLADRSNVQTRQ